jgi:hypothetical protein
MWSFPMTAGAGWMTPRGATRSAPGFLSRPTRGSRPASASRQKGPRADGAIGIRRSRLESLQWTGPWSAQAASRAADRL